MKSKAHSFAEKLFKNITKLLNNGYSVRDEEDCIVAGIYSDNEGFYYSDDDLHSSKVYFWRNGEGTTIKELKERFESWKAYEESFSVIPKD